jgi:hypothetical protein
MLRNACRSDYELEMSIGAIELVRLPEISNPEKRRYEMLLLIIVLVLVFGLGGGYYGYGRWGMGGGAGIGLGTVLLIVLICYLLGVI